MEGLSHTGYRFGPASGRRAIGWPETNMRVVTTLLAASCRLVLASGNINLPAADILTCEKTDCSSASMFTEFPVVHRSLKATVTAPGTTVRQEQEENQRGEWLCV